MSDPEAGEQIPVLGDVMDFRIEQRDDGRRWVVLYSEDYDDFARDPEGNLAVLVDQDQAGEIVSLCAQVIASLSHLDAEGDDVLRDMRDALDRQIKNGREVSDNGGGDA
jgi:hypothetical protein